MGSIVIMLNFLIASIVLTIVLGECPHPQFEETSVCNACRGWKEVLQHQKAAGADGITTVLGPPTHTFPPLYRQTGVMAKYQNSVSEHFSCLPSSLVTSV